MNTKPDHFKFYEPSGQNNIVKWLLVTLVGVILIVFLAFVYSFISIKMPIIYILWVVCIFYGIAIAFMIRFLIKFSDSRNPKTIKGTFILLAFFAAIVHWAPFLNYLADGEFPSFSEYLSEIPLFFIGNNFEVFGWLFNEGSWSIGGIQFSGFLLLLVWIVEFAIIVGPTLKSVFNLPVFPYSELQGKYYPMFTLEDKFEPIPSINSFRSKMKEGIVPGLQSLGNGIGTRYGRVHIFYLPRESKQFLTFEKVFYPTGKDDPEYSVVIENLEISSREAKEILERFVNERNRTETF